jgi:hypothetical protein
MRFFSNEKRVAISFHFMGGGKDIEDEQAEYDNFPLFYALMNQIERGSTVSDVKKFFDDSEKIFADTPESTAGKACLYHPVALCLKNGNVELAEWIWDRAMEEDLSVLEIGPLPWQGPWWRRVSRKDPILRNREYRHHKRDTDSMLYYAALTGNRAMIDFLEGRIRTARSRMMAREVFMPNPEPEEPESCGMLMFHTCCCPRFPDIWEMDWQITDFIFYGREHNMGVENADYESVEKMFSNTPVTEWSWTETYFSHRPWDKLCRCPIV